VSFNGEPIAESDETIVVGGNHYFPPTTTKGEFFESNGYHSTCRWKGRASYYDVSAND
jgi:uncharacterized protein (DUF427 family)